MQRRELFRKTAQLGAGLIAAGLQAQQGPPGGAPPQGGTPGGRGGRGGRGGGSMLGSNHVSAPAGKFPALWKQSIVPGMVLGRNMDIEAQCQQAAKMGIVGFDMIDKKSWPTMKKYGLIPTIYPFGPAGIGQASGTTGLNQKDMHDTYEKMCREAIKECVEVKCPNIIGMTGRLGIVNDEEAIDLCVSFGNRIKAQLEDAGINLIIEPVSHPNNQFTHFGPAFEMCKRVNSPRFGLLYDCYHAQLMDGNVSDTITNNIQWIKHIHTAGVPSRHQLDDNQELNYRYIARTLAEAKFSGIVGHEYSPLDMDPVAALKLSMDIFTL